MNTTMWELYWLTRVISIHDGSGTLWGVLLGALIISTAGILMSCIDIDDGKASAHFWKWIKRAYLTFGIPFIICSLLYTFTPTKEEAAFIVAGGAVVAAAQSDAGHRLADKSVAVLEGSLDTILGKEAVAKAQLDVQKKIVDAVKQQMGVKDDGKGTNSTASSGS
jgi:hypothetical protein